MGSAPSTPNQERNSDPWWLIENQPLELNPPAMSADSNNEQRVHHLDDHLAASANETINVQEENDEIVQNENVDSEVVNEETSEISESSNNEQNNENPQSNEQNSERRQSIPEQTLEEFKEELRIKREQRKCVLAELQNKIINLKRELADEKELNKKLINEKKRCRCNTTNEENSTEENPNVSTRSQLSEVHYSLQIANAEILSLTSELTVTKRQTQSLKDVIAASKQMLEIRETELSQLRVKLREIEDSLAEREVRLMSETLRQEYDRQLANIRHLKALYEERSRVSAAEKENLNRQLETSRAEFSAECEKNKNLAEHIASLDVDLKSTSDDLFATREQMAFYKAENQNLHEQMTVINQLFSQLLAGFSGHNDIDIDRLTHMLEENRDLINDITSKESCKEGAAQIPKLLLDLITHKSNDDVDAAGTSASTSQEASKETSAQEIVHNLPKVWRVLVELLNHQKLRPVDIQEDNEHCYKSVETPAGPKMVLSLSKTYIRLKDLILEKKFLQKETKKLKNLNSHLENRLGEQENRLGAVSIELNKTWNLVGRMQRQHRQLHTHEQVLRYQLQHKRRMLSELKEELEYCRRKWDLAKEKNTESQNQWELLRMEFRSRKSQDANNSAESGYSDGPASEEEDDSSASIQTESYSKRKANKEKFLLKANEPKQLKVMRNQSVSPDRNVKVSVSRRNSDSHVTQFATEEFQLQTDMVEPIVQTNCTESCGENCIMHSVHFDNSSIGAQQPSSEIKVTAPIVRNAKPPKTQAQKLVDTKASQSKKKMCCEVRKSTASTSKGGESLEEMFMRLSGQEMPKTEIEPSTSNEQMSDEDDDNEREDTPIDCSEEILSEQVLESTDHENDLIPEIEAQNELPIEPIEERLNVDDSPSTDPQPSTSMVTKTDEECLTTAERSYTQRRDERLKRLEAEFGAFMNKMKSTNRRAADVENKLEYLHGRYSSESALGRLRNNTLQNTDSTETEPSISQTEQVDEPSMENTETPSNGDDDDDANDENINQ